MENFLGFWIETKEALLKLPIYLYKVIISHLSANYPFLKIKRTIFHFHPSPEHTSMVCIRNSEKKG